MLLTGNPDDESSINILCDKSCTLSVILCPALPFSDPSACGYSSVLQGVKMGYIPHPLHFVHSKPSLISVLFPVAACPALPIHGVSMLLGNDIAGGKVDPSLQV